LKATAAQGFGKEPYSIVAHSLGGVVGLRLAASGEPVERMFTMSTPFGGSRAAAFFTLVFALTPVFADINPYGATIRSVLNGEIRIPIRSIVSTGGGTPLMQEDNDGVVTVASQTRLVGPDYHSVAVNHHEVVLAEPVIDLAREFLFGPAGRAVPAAALRA
jgi:pimeloyl-ACP methyl ester carboxylesterase